MRVEIGHNKTSRWGVYIEVGLGGEEINKRFWLEEEFDDPAVAEALARRVEYRLMAVELVMPAKPENAHKYVPKTFMVNAECAICSRPRYDACHMEETNDTDRAIGTRREPCGNESEGAQDAESTGGCGSEGDALPDRAEEPSEREGGGD